MRELLLQLHLVARAWARAVAADQEQLKHGQPSQRWVAGSRQPDDIVDLICEAPQQPDALREREATAIWCHLQASSNAPSRRPAGAEYRRARD